MFVEYEITMKIAFVTTCFQVFFIKCVINHLWLFHISFFFPFQLMNKKLYTHVYIFPPVLTHGKTLEA